MKSKFSDEALVKMFNTVMNSEQARTELFGNIGGDIVKLATMPKVMLEKLIAREKNDIPEDWDEISKRGKRRCTAAVMAALDIYDALNEALACRMKEMGVEE